MPRPRYILLCENRLVDRATGLSTHVNVVDKIEVERFSTPPDEEGVKYRIPVVPIANLVLTAVWMREEGDDEEAEYEFDILIHRPGEEPDTIAQGEFSFLKTFHRIDVGIVFTTQSKFQRDGILLLENRLRRKPDEGEWITQSFPIEVDTRHSSGSA